ncbi:MAG: BlaI/MecI/CopY family transcriptional regulator [Bacillota bacterium]
MKKRFLAGYHPGRPGLEKVLGSLESEIMDVIWRKDAEVCVRDVLETLAGNREIAYTTVMTIMGRLANKKLLERRKVGNAFFFKAVLTREAFTEAMVGSVIDDLLTDFSDATLACFMHRVRNRDLETVEKLEKLLTATKEQNDGSAGE